MLVRICEGFLVVLYRPKKLPRPWPPSEPELERLELKAKDGRKRPRALKLLLNRVSVMLFCSSEEAPWFPTAEELGGLVAKLFCTSVFL